MKPEELLEDIIGYCLQNADEQIVKKYSRYFKQGGYQAYGLTSELLYAKADELLRRPDVSHDLVVKTSHLLVQLPEYEMTSFAVLLLKHYKKQFDHDAFNVVGAWFEKGIHNWAHCDIICSELFPVFYAKNLITYHDLAPWKTATNKFQRRAVPVSMIKLLKTHPDLNGLFQFIDPMLTDKEREVHQGLGWFLREAWKINPLETEVFLYKWKNMAPRLIFQYATEKMDREARLRFRKEK